MDVVDDSCFMTIDSGYEITDSESKQSNIILMLAIAVIMNDGGGIERECVNKDCVFGCR
jgi:hypothetical protein